MGVGSALFGFAAFLCVWAANSSVQHIHEDTDTVDKTWDHCIQGTHDNVILDLFLHQANTATFIFLKSDVALLRRKKAISDLPPEEKQILLECLSRKHASISTYQEVVPRRYLRERKLQDHDIAAPVPAPSPSDGAVSPNYAPVPSSEVPASSPSPVSYPPSSVIETPSKAPTPPAKEPSHVSPPSKVPTPQTRANSSKPLPVIPSPGKPQNTGTNSSENNNKDGIYIIAIVSVGAVAGIALVALLLILFIRKSEKKETGPKCGLRDEKPLLNFCSADSSQKSSSIGSSMKTDFKSSSITVNSFSVPTDSQKSSEAEGTTDSPVNANANVTLPLPPGKSVPPPPGPPPPPPPKPPAPKAPPPPPPKAGRPPPTPPKPGNLPKPLPPGAHKRRTSSGGAGTEQSDESDVPKAKLKPFFWDKVLANPDHSMVWHDIKAGSFQFNEEMMESLFGYNQANPGKSEGTKAATVFEATPQYIQIIDAKKAQNLAIILKALNVTTSEVCDALKEGNKLPPELIENLSKMAPTTDEELKLRLYCGEISQLGPAERFLKSLVEIPFAFKRMDALLLMSSLEEEVSSIKESFATLEVACQELRNSRLFLKLLEAVLKTGNRMNVGTYRGGAQAFKLDTLLKLSDVKGTDGKTTLLNFVLQEIIRSEGLRAARKLRESKSMSSVKAEDVVDDSVDYHSKLGLEVVSGLSNELENVRKAALIDGDSLTAGVSKLGSSLVKTKGFLDSDMKSLEEESKFRDTVTDFMQHAEEEIKWILEEEKKIMALVKSTGDYFHGNAGKDEGLRLFTVVRDFLIMLDKACAVVRKSSKLPANTARKGAPLQECHPDSVGQGLFPAIQEQRMDDDFSSDDESSKP